MTTNISLLAQTVLGSPALDTRASRKLNAWIASLRPKTLPLAGCGILTGTASALALGAPWQPGIFFSALATALLLQILANLANDLGDAEKSADTPERIGPLRGMQLGLISPREMKKALILTIGITVASGLALMAMACRTSGEALFFLLLGLSSIVAALTYTMGRSAYGYRGLGDASVFLFFGLAAVAGSFYLQTRFWDWRALWPASACGLLSMAVLNINNLRDLEEDQKHGKATFAAKIARAFGMKWAFGYHLALLFAALACLAISALAFGGVWPWLFVLALPLYAQNIRIIARLPEAQVIAGQLPVVVKLSMVSLVGLAAGLALNLATG
ncbi:MAG: 1,4-dihydroxy-2-naphthoate octaprenyltransferase [Zoogloeaceae bacterium]|jgi:1,4-dihydroxy-2-naphthoate octaprenyltransferase|nr:1,4-dihydroxy-2-naphthoate octaprenyltransferase [Zoogloeaceae bacterium]